MKQDENVCDDVETLKKFTYLGDKTSSGDDEMRLV